LSGEIEPTVRFRRVVWSRSDQTQLAAQDETPNQHASNESNNGENSKRHLTVSTWQIESQPKQRGEKQNARVLLFAGGRKEKIG
jgi:hypothetical protein